MAKEMLFLRQFAGQTICQKRFCTSEVNPLPF